MDTRDVVVVDREVIHIVEDDGIVSTDDGVVLNQQITGVTGLNIDGVSGRRELVAGDVDALGFVVEVHPDVGHLATVYEHVVRDGEVVCTDLAGLVAVVVRRSSDKHTNATISERVSGDDVSIATEDTHALVVPGNRTVECGVAGEVREGVVGDLEEVKLVAVVEARAHCTVDGSKTGDGRVVHVDVHRVVVVAHHESLWRTAA